MYLIGVGGRGIICHGLGLIDRGGGACSQDAEHVGLSVHNHYITLNMLGKVFIITTSRRENTF